MGLECGWRHARKRWSREFEDFEKVSVEKWDWTMELSRWGFGHWVEELGFRISTDRDNEHHKMHRALGMGRIVRIVSLSSYRNGPKSRN